MLPAAAAVLAMLTLMSVQGARLYDDARQLADSVPVLLAFVAIYWLTLAVHEAAHGLTCIHFGGTSPEIGLLWRFPLLAPYCKADDVMLFARRRHRCYTAFAGVFAQLLTLTPAALLWPLLPAGPARTLCAALVLYGSGSTLLNLIPFLQLDGYFMLNHALNMVNLRAGAYRFWARVLDRLRGRAATGEYPRPAGWAYGAYGVASFVFATGLVVGLFAVWFGQLRGPLGAAAAASVLGGVALFGVVMAVVLSRRARRRTAPAVSAVVP
ncbi:hypothetical protein ACFQZ4_50455 [Catellatospora coxensis]